MYAIPTTDLCWGFLELLHRIPQKKKHTKNKTLRSVDLHELEIWEVSFLNQTETGESLWNRGNLYKVCQQIKENQILLT